jgi:hypothetical protein
MFPIVIGDEDNDSPIDRLNSYLVNKKKSEFGSQEPE